MPDQSTMLKKRIEALEEKRESLITEYAALAESEDVLTAVERMPVIELQISAIEDKIDVTKNKLEVSLHNRDVAITKRAVAEYQAINDEIIADMLTLDVTDLRKVTHKMMISLDVKARALAKTRVKDGPYPLGLTDRDLWIEKSLRTDLFRLTSILDEIEAHKVGCERYRINGTEESKEVTEESKT